MNRMIKYLIYILLFIQSTAISFAQVEYSLITNTTEVKSKIKKASEELKSMQASFVQDKVLTFMDEEIQSKGKFIFQSPNSVRWEYIDPYKYLIIIDKEIITIKDERKENKFDMDSNPIFKQINQLMLSTVKGDILLNKDFESKVYQNSKTYKLELLPKDENMKEFISSIDLILNKKDLTIISLKLTEPMGDYTFITFKNKIINEKLPEHSFTIR